MNFPADLVTELLPLAAAATKKGNDAPGPQWMQPLLFIGVMFFILYILMIHPQRKRQKQRVEMLEALKKGDSVLTRGGIYGTITHVRADSKVVVKVDDDVKLTLSKAGIARVLTSEDENAEDISS